MPASRAIRGSRCARTISPTPCRATSARSTQFLTLLGLGDAQEDGSNRLVGVEPQLGWLREIGFADVECFWKWREMALIGGAKGP